MKGRRYFVILALSIVGGVVTGLAFAATGSGSLFLPVIIMPLSLITIGVYGSVCGIIISPVAYWCLRDKKLSKVVPIIYLSVIVATWISNIIWVRIEPNVVAFYPVLTMMIITIIALLVARFFGQRTNVD